MEAIALIAFAGLDPWPVLRSRDATFVAVSQRLAERVIELREDRLSVHRKDLAARIANVVGRMLG